MFLGMSTLDGALKFSVSVGRKGRAFVFHFCFHHSFYLGRLHVLRESCKHWENKRAVEGAVCAPDFLPLTHGFLTQQMGCPWAGHWLEARVWTEWLRLDSASPQPEWHWAGSWEGALPRKTHCAIAVGTHGRGLGGETWQASSGGLALVPGCWVLRRAGPSSGNGLWPKNWYNWGTAKKVESEQAGVAMMFTFFYYTLIQENFEKEIKIFHNHSTQTFNVHFLKNILYQSFPGSPVAKTSPSNFGGGRVGLIPGQGGKVPTALRLKKQNIRQMKHCNKFNKTL